MTAEVTQERVCRRAMMGRRQREESIPDARRRAYADKEAVDNVDVAHERAPQRDDGRG